MNPFNTKFVKEFGIRAGLAHLLVGGFVVALIAFGWTGRLDALQMVTASMGPIVVMVVKDYFGSKQQPPPAP